MAKYSDEFKRRIVEEYHQGSLGYKLLAKKHGIPSKSVILRWVSAYRTLGPNGLTRKQTQTVYPVHFKKDVINFMKHTGASLQEAANQFGINNPSLLSVGDSLLRDLGWKDWNTNRKDDHPCLKTPIRNN